LFSIGFVGGWLGRLGRPVGEDTTNFDPNRFAGETFERRQRSRRGPHFELGVARRAQLQQIIVAAIVELEAGDRLGVAAIEALREPQHRRERTHRLPHAPGQTAEAFVLPLRRRLAVIAGDERDHLNLVRLEAAQVAVGDQVVRVLVVPFVADVHADVVQDRRVLEPLALAVGQAVNRPGLVEQRQREPGHVI
jgi:hypothetical protein